MRKAITAVVGLVNEVIHTAVHKQKSLDEKLTESDRLK